MNCEQDVNPVHFLYADGLRKSKVVNGEKTIFFNDGQNVIIEADGSYNLKAIYTLGLGYIRRTDAKNNKYYYLYDAHGDVTVLTDSEGNIVKSYDYDIYGQGKESEYLVDIENPIRYTGQYFDEESGLYYLRARYYSPDIMRFISEDTYKGKISNPVTLNLYAYCGGNPVMLYDPSGNSWEYLGDEYTRVQGGGGSATATRYMFDFEAEWEGGLNQVVDIAVGFTPVDIIVDGMSFAAGYNILTKEEQSRLTSLGYIIAPGVIEQGGKSVKVLKKVNVCFVEGTLVSTEEGLRPIDEIEAGDKVYAQNEKTGEKELKEVKHLFRNKTNTLINLKINGEEIITTEQHPFWVEDKGWILAGDLVVGYKVVKRDGSTVTVEDIRIERLEEEIRVYNFEVEDYHTYFVGWQEILVHNDCMESVAKGVSNATKYSSIDKGLNFSSKALEHMGESARQVPVQTLQDAIRYGKALPDPRGSSATMYYTTMNINKKFYNLEVLYDKATNTVYHFEYARKAMGNLPAIKK